MKLKSLLAAVAATLTIASPAFADIIVLDPYARSSGPTAKSGAAFLMIQNTGDGDDQLIGVASDIAKRVELHTHLESSEGVMRMMHVAQGFTIPADSMVQLKRGGKHVMFMGLNGAMDHGDTFTVTLIFRDAGEITVTIPVDLERKPMKPMGDLNTGS